MQDFKNQNTNEFKYKIKETGTRIKYLELKLNKIVKKIPSILDKDYDCFNKLFEGCNCIEKVNFIKCNRNDIENYCKTNNLQPRIDKSNFENIYTRNKIRNILIPQIKKDFNSNIIEALNKLSCIAREENSFVDSYIENVINEKLIINDLEIDNGVVINLKEFNKLDNYIKSRAVLSLIQKVLGTTQGIEKKHVDDIVLMCAKNIGNKYLKPNKHIKVMVNGGKVYFTTE